MTPWHAGAISQVATRPAIAAIARILLIEDDDDVASIICEELSLRGYDVSHCMSGIEGLAAAETAEFDLLITDCVLPGLDGLTLIERLRLIDRRLPILMISARRSLEDRVSGLSAGGDDYLTKPFEVSELSARVAALLRRAKLPNDSQLRVGNLILNLIDRSVRRGERNIELLPREFKLLEYLMRHAGRPVTRSMLLEDVWNYRFVPQTNLVDVHIGRLRRKIDGPNEPPLLESIRGTGFMLREPS
jgi:two-component system OmpR family response regulator